MINVDPGPQTLFQVNKSAIKGYMRRRIIAPTCSGAYPTLAGSNVDVDNFGPIQAADCPAIRIFATEETNEILGTVLERRRLKIVIELNAAGDDAGVQIDLMGDVIILLFQNDEYLGGVKDGLVEWCRYSGGELTYDEKRHFNGMSWLLKYDVHYIYDNAPNLQIARIAPFETAVINTTFGEGDTQGATIPTTADTAQMSQT